MLKEDSVQVKLASFRQTSQPIYPAFTPESDFQPVADGAIGELGVGRIGDVAYDIGIRMMQNSPNR